MTGTFPLLSGQRTPQERRARKVKLNPRPLRRLLKTPTITGIVAAVAVAVVEEEVEVEVDEEATVAVAEGAEAGRLYKN